MPYDDEDRRRFTIDGLPADYYPSRRSRLVISAILAGFIFVMFSSSHPVFFANLYHGAVKRAAWLLPADKRLGDWPTTGELYKASGVATA